MLDVREFQRLKAAVDRLRTEADKAAGAHAEHLKRLEDEFGCTDVAQAEKLLAKLSKEADAVEKTYHKLLDKFHQDWNEVLT